MNPNQPTPELNDAVLQKLNSHLRKGRVLTAVALGIGLLSIAIGILIAWGSTTMLMPMERLLLYDYPAALQQSNTNSPVGNPTGAKSSLTRDELDWRHVQVTAVHGKVIILTAAATALTGVGTFLTLLLVIFNRRATLRQINANLAQISLQIKELQAGNRPGSK
jgi:hypothetical protein